MWLKTFDQRLQSWHQMRTLAQTSPIEPALETINTWWFESPWQPYYLHWDDLLKWPDPWQLLSDNVYCDLARALGILYTISLLDRTDMADAELVLAEDGSNLVLVAKEKYILNWNKESIVNTHQAVKISRKLKQHQIK